MSVTDISPQQKNLSVTIMIPTYNQAQYIVACVESALNQSYPHLEVIVCDDSPGLETQQLLSIFLDDPRFRYHRNPERLGRLENYRRLLFQLAGGDYVLMLDGDDYLLDHQYISWAVEKILGSRNIVYVKACHTRDESLMQSPMPGAHDNRILKGRAYIRNTRAFLGEFSHLSTVYNRSLAIKCDMYHLNDVFGFIQLATMGDVCVLNRIVGVWRKTGTNISDSLTMDSYESIFQMANQLRGGGMLSKCNATSMRLYYMMTLLGVIIAVRRNRMEILAECSLMISSDSLNLSRYSWIVRLIVLLPNSFRHMAIKFVLLFT